MLSRVSKLDKRPSSVQEIRPKYLYVSHLWNAIAWPARCQTLWSDAGYHAGVMAVVSGAFVLSGVFTLDKSRRELRLSGRNPLVLV